MERIRISSRLTNLSATHSPVSLYRLLNIAVIDTNGSAMDNE